MSFFSKNLTKKYPFFYKNLEQICEKIYEKKDVFMIFCVMEKVLKGGFLEVNIGHRFVG